MKKLLLVTLCLLLATAAIGCTATAATSQPEPSSGSASDSQPPSSTVQPPPDSNASSESEAPAGLPFVNDPDNRLTVADAMQYRGTVTKVSTDVPKADGTGSYALVLTLEQAKGTNFGAPSLQFAIDENTRLGFEVEGEMEWEGAYLEVYYSYMTKNAPDPDAVYDAIAINYLGVAEMVNFNGTVAEIVPHPDKEGEGRYLMTDLENPEYQVFFLYGPQTQFYMNQSDIKVGDQLNIFHSPAMALSLPPQCAAWEIRPYAAP